MYSYKVIHLESTETKKKGIFDSSGNLDGYTISKELEALLIEKNQEGFDLITITPINGYKVIQGSFAASVTKSLIVTFKKRFEV